MSSKVKLWAFGHTHSSCNFRDEETGKLIIANQKGYAGITAGRKKVGMEAKVVVVGEEGWVVVDGRKSGKEEQI